MKQRKRRNSIPNIHSKLLKLNQKLQDGVITGFSPCEKKIRGVNNNASGRRSRYVGVSKNSNNWQVLINMNNQKVYIGSYPTQEEAAVVYDFYSIVVHGKKAKTNFYYDRDTLLYMVNSFMATGKIPNQFRRNSICQA